MTEEQKKKWSVIKKVDEEVLKSTIQRCKERKIIIPTFEELRDPSKIPQKIKDKLKDIDMQDTHPLNLFRISWKNEPKEKGGLYNDGNFIEFPSSLTGCKARIVGIVGKHFPTGAHKVGAGFGCLVPRLVSGSFDPTKQKAVWPSTGNFCRGGAFDCSLLACDAVAILPKGMSKERFEWLKSIGCNEVIGTPGSESNVKEIYDKCWELRRTRKDKIVIFNQFEEFGNCIFHYFCTGSIIEEIYEKFVSPKVKGSRFAGYISATGSAGTIAAGDYLRKKYPELKVCAVEALQCPTLLNNGFGAHRIEGIGDKHVPFVHNCRNTDTVTAIDDERCMQLIRLFNEPEGQKYLKKIGVPEDLIKQLPILGISSVCNLIASIKTAKYYELTEKDVLFCCLTDSMDLYESRVAELREEDKKNGKREFDEGRAEATFERWLMDINTDHYKELLYTDKKAMHNFKYFTWVEQQGKTIEELNDLWLPEFWDFTFGQVGEWDKMIKEFNKKTGVFDSL